MVMMIVLLLEKASYVAGWRDANGLTPLHKAAYLNKTINLIVIKLIFNYCPQSVEVCDSFGKSILHHLVNRILDLSEGTDFLHQTYMDGLKNHQDHDGNTALHLSTLHSDFIMTYMLTYTFEGNLTLQNNDGLSPSSLLEQKHMSKV
ncbi:Transcription factor MBP1 [Bienertia sinuspersici]